MERTSESPGKLRNRSLFDFLKSRNLLINKNAAVKQNLYNFVITSIKYDDITEELEIAIRSKITMFVEHLYNRWTAVNRDRCRFLQKYEDWLNLEITFPNEKLCPEVQPSRATELSSMKRSIRQRESEIGQVNVVTGRPSKTYERSSERAKRRKAAAIAENMTTPELVHATRVKLQKKGHRTSAGLVKEITTTPKNARDFKKNVFDTTKNMPIPYTDDEAVAFLVDNNLTTRQYNNIRSEARRRNADIYPSYHRVSDAKKKCYPEHISASEVECKIPLQDLLDHTVNRVFQIPDINMDITQKNCRMIYKWGCDGTSDFTRYKQRFTDSSQVCTSETSMFVVSLVPLELSYKKEIIWKNTRFSSTRFCRPLQFQYAKETSELTKSTTNKINNEIENLVPTRIEIEGEEIFVEHVLIMTMINGKVCTALTEVPSQNCQICQAKPSQMNDLKRAEVQGDTKSLGYCISVLHTNIRCFECLIHVAYRLDFKKWMATKKEDKEKLGSRKMKIQEKFRSETGLLIDIVLQGKGTTNDGNTARRFFRDFKKSADITGINVQLIQRFRNILAAINCGYEINVQEFKIYALDTAKLFTDLYPWYYMPAHMHKLLLHGADIINHMLLPLGQLSEEAAEASNKNIRKTKREHTRKNSRLNTNEDLLKMLLVASDPLISSLRKIHVKKVEKLPDDAQILIFKKEEERKGEDEEGEEEEEEEDEEEENYESDY